MSMTDFLKSRPAMTSTAAPAIALLCYVLLHWKGIGLSPDGWAAWQGAASLASGNGITYFSGNSIFSWPPLYFLYLCLWIFVLGPTGWSLLASNGVLIVAQAFLWMRCVELIARDCRLDVSPTSRALLSIFIALYVAVHQLDVVTQNLLYAVLPLFLYALWRLVSRPGTGIDTPALLPVIGFGTALLLTHHASLGFVAAASLLLVTRRPLSIRSFVPAGLVSGIPVLIWAAVRLASEQSEGHYIGFGAGQYPPWEYVAQLFEGVGSLLAPTRFGAHLVALSPLAVAIFALRRGTNAVGLRFGLAFVLYASTVIFLLFNLTWISAPLSRYSYIAFVPLILVPLAFVTALNVAPQAAKGAMLLALVPQIYWTAVWIERQHRNSLAELGLSQDYDSVGFVPPNAFIQRTYRAKPPLETKDGLLVAPISFEEWKLRK